MPKALEIYLPASAPENLTFGKPPEAAIIPGNSLFNVAFDIEVWYNQEWREKSIAQIRPALLEKNILIGFSKSGLGALNIAIENINMFSTVVIFDAPLMHQKLPPWNTADFYTQAVWEKDSPGARLSAIKTLSENTKIIHIGGGNFQKDHQAFQALLKEEQIESTFLSRPNLDHHWDSGWLMEGIELAI